MPPAWSSARTTNFAVVDFWRFWVVHLWVEDFLELFTTIMVAYIFVLLGVVRQTTATRVVYLDIILYSIGGVIGTMHHLYFSGAPAHAHGFGRFLLGHGSHSACAADVRGLAIHAARLARREPARPWLLRLGQFPHKWAVMFLIAVGFWNFLGAGVFGFLINLPIVSYYEIGTSFTANHGHGAMMGVYGMLAIGFFMFVARYFIPPDRRQRTGHEDSFWSLNIGLGLMVFVNLVPMGIIQLYDAFQNGYMHARGPELLRADRACASSNGCACPATCFSSSAEFSRWFISPFGCSGNESAMAAPPSERMRKDWWRAEVAAFLTGFTGLTGSREVLSIL